LDRKREKVKELEEQKEKKERRKELRLPKKKINPTKTLQNSKI
jgi:hypothetical protein